MLPPAHAQRRLALHLEMPNDDLFNRGAWDFPAPPLDPWPGHSSDFLNHPQA